MQTFLSLGLDEVKLISCESFSLKHLVHGQWRTAVQIKSWSSFNLVILDDWLFIASAYYSSHMNSHMPHSLLVLEQVINHISCISSVYVAFHRCQIDSSELVLSLSPWSCSQHFWPSSLLRDSIWKLASASQSLDQQPQSHQPSCYAQASKLCRLQRKFIHCQPGSSTDVPLEEGLLVLLELHCGFYMVEVLVKAF